MSGPDVAEKYSEKLWIRLRGLYNEAKARADDEERYHMKSFFL